MGENPPPTSPAAAATGDGRWAGVADAGAHSTPLTCCLPCCLPPPFPAFLGFLLAMERGNQHIGRLGGGGVPLQATICVRDREAGMEPKVGLG